ncbi:dTDP-4-dehydrorhamnose reductase [Acidobacteria bacterium AH-259-D05]|nr:dTDP-4-dehydrorhamnose reductase [Acidobacteria bacterium AH-259-D05]
MKIAITGATGMLGQALCKTFSKHCLYPLSSRDLDVTSGAAARRIFSELKPDWIIHTAGFTQVDAAESNALEAYRVNALGTRNVAVSAYENHSSLLYYSTDYVFDGAKDRPYREWDLTNPLSVYGQSKLAGEFFVRSLCPQHLIVRTSWLFGAGGSHFVQKIMDLAQKKDNLDVVCDQRGSPTFTNDLAYMTLCLVEAEKRGTYHVTNSGHCSWDELAREIISLRGFKSEVHPIDSSAFAAPARRPQYSVLDNYLLQLEGIPLLRSWQGALAAFLSGVARD